MTHCIPEGTLYPIKGKFVDSSVAAVKPLDSTWARNPIPRIHTDNVGMAFVGKCTADCHQAGAAWCNEKDDCQQFPSPCPFDKAWYGPNTSATHMPTNRNFLPDERM